MSESRLLFYAPNVHTGGGLTLLAALMADWPPELALLAWLDDRARSKLRLPPTSRVTWVRATAIERLRGELSLQRACGPNDLVLCFHGLPPVFRTRARVQVFQQNRLLLHDVDLRGYEWRTRQRLRVERLLSSSLKHRVDTYWVQTSSMASAVSRWYGDNCPAVLVVPFAAIHHVAEGGGRTPALAEKKWEFVYVADGEAHKNHRALIGAWRRLAAAGLRPSLALTLSERHSALRSWINDQIQAHDLRIFNLGQLGREEVLQLYTNSRALVFPSLNESFGLPLLEAKAVGIPILASERDFVRDVCEPVHTFDPGSEVSIARAIRRFLGNAEPVQNVLRPGEFLNALISQVKESHEP